MKLLCSSTTLLGLLVASYYNIIIFFLLFYFLLGQGTEQEKKINMHLIVSLCEMVLTEIFERFHHSAAVCVLSRVVFKCSFSSYAFFFTVVCLL